MGRTFRFGPRAKDVPADVRREIDAHLAERAEEFEAQGMTSAEARAAALKAFGDRGGVETELLALRSGTVRSRRRRLWREEWWQDASAAVRGFARAPLYTAIALLTLALAIGANVAAFGVLRSVVLRPLPYPEADRLVQVWTDHRALGRADPEWLTPPQYFAFRDRVPAFERIGAYQGWNPSLTGEGEPETIPAGAVSAGFLQVLGAGMALGRGFTEADDAATAEPVVVLTDGLWRRRFGADPGIVGKVIQLNGTPWTVIGVLAEGFQPPVAWDLVRPLRRPADSGCNHGCIVYRAIARLAPGATLQQARQQMTAALAVDAAENERVGPWPIPLQEQIVGPVRPALVALTGAVGLVLLIACVNLASLGLVRAGARAREFAVRGALGAGRGRILRQLVTENLVLAGAGGLLGLALGAAGARLLGALVPPAVLALQPVTIDVTVTAFAIGVTGLAALLFGILPAIRAARPDLMGVLRTAHPDGAQRVGLARRALVVAELAIALTLLVGAGLLLRTLLNLQRTDLGFAPGQVLQVGLAYPSSRYPEIATVASATDLLLERLRANPAIRSAEVNDVPPLTPGGDQDVGVLADGAAPGPGGQGVGLWYRSVSPGALRLLGIRLVAGREFGPEDEVRGGELAGILTEEAARRLWPDQDPVGRFVSSQPGGEGTRVRIIGVAADVRHDGPRQPVKAQLFLANAQLTSRGPVLLVEPSGPPEAAAGAIRATIRELDPLMPVPVATPLAAGVADALAMPRRFATILGSFAAAALLLALVGVFGAMAYVVNLREREIGVRLALGADPRRVESWVLREGALLTATGVALGLGLALAGTRLLGATLHGVGAIDPLTFGVVVAVIGGTALVACWIPARRVRAIDPVMALRAE